MIQKIKNQAFESNENYSNTYAEKTVHALLEKKIYGLTYGVIIPDNLINEAERFIDRNIIEESNAECCSRCLKAHIKKKAEEMGLSIKEQEFLNKMIPGEEGHNGYYLDGEEVKKI